MDTYHQQLLLEYLGFSPGMLDGLPGAETTNAVRRFQEAYGLTQDGVCGVQTEKALLGAVAGTTEPAAKDTNAKGGSFWDELKYFTRGEYGIACPCGRCGGFPVEPTEKLMRLAEKVRAEARAPMYPSSTVRCMAHNAELPNSASNSRHLFGRAMDFRIQGWSADKTLALVKTMPEAAYAYKITDTYVHMDVI